MKRDFLTYQPSGVYEIPVYVPKYQVGEVIENLKQLDSFVRVEVLGLGKYDYKVTAILKDPRDVTWFKLKWV